MAAKKAYDKKTYVDWYKTMLLSRKFEEKCGHLYVQQKFGGFCHLYIGQEAILAGLMTGIKKDDNVPDHVLFGLILGTINGPPNDFPTMYATVSFKKEMNIKIKIKFSSKLLRRIKI